MVEAVTTADSEVVAPLAEVSAPLAATRALPSALHLLSSLGVSRATQATIAHAHLGAAACRLGRLGVRASARAVHRLLHAAQDACDAFVRCAARSSTAGFAEAAHRPSPTSTHLAKSPSMESRLVRGLVASDGHLARLLPCSHASQRTACVRSRACGVHCRSGFVECASGSRTSARPITDHTPRGGFPPLFGGQNRGPD